MLEPRSAEIIPFPAKGPTAGHSPPQGPERLREALAALDDALMAQRRAVGEWRDSLADLREATRSLGESVRAYRNGLNTLGIRVAGLHSEATELARRAEPACSPQPCHGVPRRM